MVGVPFFATEMYLSSGLERKYYLFHLLIPATYVAVTDLCSSELDTRLLKINCLGCIFSTAYASKIQDNEYGYGMAILYGISSFSIDTFSEFFPLVASVLTITTMYALKKK